MSPEESLNAVGPRLAHSRHPINDPFLRRGSRTPWWEGGPFTPPRLQSHLPRAL